MTTENGSTVYTGRGGSEQRWCLAWVGMLGCQAQQENGMKEVIVWLLVKFKRTNITDEFAEGSR
jgi:hypothetical protein